MKIIRETLLVAILFYLPLFALAGEIIINDADSIWSQDLIAASNDVIDSTDAPPPNLSEAFISNADTVWSANLEKGEIAPPPQPKNWSFAVITDLHLGRGYPDYGGEDYEDGEDGQDYYLTERLNKVVNWLTDNKDNIDCAGTKCSIKFLAVLGDFADSAEKSEFLKAKNILDKLNEYDIPYIPVFGNHDVWPYTDNKEAPTTLGENYFDEIFWNENSTNTKLLETKLNFQRDDVNTKYKNLAFSYKGMNFIGLDFVDRKPFPGPWRGVSPAGEIFNETSLWFTRYLKENEPTIIFSHHPFIMNPVVAFSALPLEPEMTVLDEIIKISKANVLADFSGHVHGFEEWYGTWPENANIVYPTGIHWYTPANIPVITTEASMVGSNGKNPKGIIRIVKVLNQSQIDYNNWETTEGTTTEFKALNPYISFAFTQPTEILPCVFFKAQVFTKRAASYRWDFGDNTTGTGKWETRCYSAPGVYNVTLTLTDTDTGATEYITRNVEVKEGIIPKFLKITEAMAEKIELISTKLEENLTMWSRPLGQIFSDDILVKVKHSPAEPVGLFTVHFEKATEDIDLTNLVADTNTSTKKSILYMQKWPSVVEQEKVLFIPK